MPDKQKVDTPIEVFGYFLDLALQEKEDEYDDSIQSVE